MISVLQFYGLFGRQVTPQLGSSALLSDDISCYSIYPLSLSLRSAKREANPNWHIELLE